MVTAKTEVAGVDYLLGVVGDRSQLVSKADRCCPSGRKFVQHGQCRPLHIREW